MGEKYVNGIEWIYRCEVDYFKNENVEYIYYKKNLNEGEYVYKNTSKICDIYICKYYQLH